MSEHLHHDPFVDVPDLRCGDRLAFGGYGDALSMQQQKVAAQAVHAKTLGPKDPGYKPPTPAAGAKTTGASTPGTGSIDKVAADGKITTAEQKTVFTKAKATTADVDSSVQRFQEAVSGAASKQPKGSGGFTNAQTVQRMENGADGKGGSSNGKRGAADILDGNGNLVYNPSGDKGQSGSQDNADNGALGSAHNVATWNRAITAEKSIISADHITGTDNSGQKKTLTTLLQDRTKAQGSESSIVNDINARKKYVGGLTLQKSANNRAQDPKVKGTPANTVATIRSQVDNMRMPVAGSKGKTKPIDWDAVTLGSATKPSQLLDMKHDEYERLQKENTDGYGKYVFSHLNSYRNPGSDYRTAQQRVTEAKQGNTKINGEIAYQNSTIQRYTSVLSPDTVEGKVPGAPHITANGATALGGAAAGASGSGKSSDGKGTGKAKNPPESPEQEVAEEKRLAAERQNQPTTAQLSKYLTGQGYSLAHGHVEYTVQSGDDLDSIAGQVNNDWSKANASVSGLAQSATYEQHPDLAAQTHGNANLIYIGENMQVPVTMNQVIDAYQSSNQGS